MCSDDPTADSTTSSHPDAPLHLFHHGPIYDAHCHPTDILFPQLPSPTDPSPSLSPSSIEFLIKTHMTPCLGPMSTTTLTAMSTRTIDQPLVFALANLHPEKIVPGFGYHPWFSHLIWDDGDGELRRIWDERSAKGEGEGEGEEDVERRKEWERRLKFFHYGKVLKPDPRESSDEKFIDYLPMPRMLSEVISEVRGNILEFLHSNDGSHQEREDRPQPRRRTKRRVILGEVGLDRNFRLPWPPGYPIPIPSSDTQKSKNPPRFSPYRVSIAHQSLIFISQLRIAGELSVPASVHSVGAHGVMFDTLRSLWRGWEVQVESRRERRRREKRLLKKKEAGKELTEGEKEWIRKWREDMVYDPEEESDSNSDGEGEDDEDPWVDGEPIEKHPKGQTNRNKAKQKQDKPPPFPPRLCLHSFSAPPENLLQYLTQPTSHTIYPTKMYFSFSTTINANPPRRPREQLQPQACDSTTAITIDPQQKKLEEVLRKVPKDRLLVESDWHTPGEEMDGHVARAVELVGRVRGWGEAETVEALEENWWGWVVGDGDEDGGGDGHGEEGR